MRIYRSEINEAVFLKIITHLALQWCTPAIPAAQEDHKVEASLSNLVRSCLKIKKNKRLGIWLSG